MGRVISGGSGTPPGPPIVTPLPGVGKDLEHRWHASRAALAADGVTVLSWPDAITSATTDNLLRTVFDPGTPPEPLLITDTSPAMQYVRIAGIDLAGQRQLAPPRSWFAVFRSSVLNTQTVKIAGVTISRAGNSKIKVAFGGGVSLFGSSTSAAWHSVIVNADTSAASCTIDGIYQAAGAYTAGPSGGMYTVHQMGDGTGGGTKYVDLHDHGTSSVGWNSDDQASVYAGLKANSPVLP